MAVALDTLLDSLQASLNVPGAAKPMFDFTDEDPWITALANGFWQSRARGFYTSFRIDTNGENIVNVVGGDDMLREDQQVIVIQTAITAVKAEMLNLFTKTRDKAGPTETERERSSTLLKQLLVDLRTELEDIRKQVVLGGGATTARVIDSILTRSGYLSGVPHWING